MLSIVVPGAKRGSDAYLAAPTGRRPTERVTASPGGVQANNRNVVPLTIVHSHTYVDYSHGIRAVHIDGRPHDLHAALHDPAFCTLFSDEGPIAVASY